MPRRLPEEGFWEEIEHLIDRNGERPIDLYLAILCIEMESDPMASDREEIFCDTDRSE